jgi:hypothetical protein
MHRQQRQGVPAPDDAFGINAIAFGAEGEKGGFLGGVIGGVGDAWGKRREQSGFLCRIGTEDHHRTPAKGEGGDGGGGGDGHGVCHGGAARAKAAMIQPFAKDHGTGAEQGPPRPIGLVQGGISSGARRFLHAMNLVYFQAKWKTWRRGKA